MGFLRGALQTTSLLLRPSLFTQLNLLLLLFNRGVFAPLRETFNLRKSAPAP